MDERTGKVVRVAREHAESASAALDVLRTPPPKRPVGAMVSEAQELLDQVQLVLDRLGPR